MKYKDMYSFLKKYYKAEKNLLIKGIILIFISSILGVLYGYFMGLAIDKTAIGAFSSAILIIVFYLIIGTLDDLVFNRIGQICIQKVSNNVMEKINYDVYHKVGLLPARAFEEKTSGEFINRITSDASTIREAFQNLLRTFIALWTSLIVFIYICFNSWIVALEVIIYLIGFFFFSKKFMPEIKKAQKEITKEKDKAVAEVNENIRGIREIRALGIREKLNLSIKNTIRGIYYKTNKQMIVERNYWAVVSTLNAIFEAVVFITCILLIYFSKTSFAFVMSITYYLYKFMNTIDWMMNFSTSFQKMKVSVERIDEILNNRLYEDEHFGTVKKTNINGLIEFKNINFKYANEEAAIFENLNLIIEPKKKIAIVGKSGQGKTSIFNLLLRYFEPNEGVILIDDTPLYDFSEEALRKNIAIIRQDPFLFNKSILDNLKIVNEKLSLKKIREACVTAEIDEYIMSLPNKYNTIIGEGGVNLSGGQKQRLAIARALLKNSKIILFDEATSALDNASQSKIKKAIDNLVKDHTIIIVAHRLSTIIDADIIHVIDKGKVVASGTHTKLLSKNKIYKALYKEEM